MVSLIQFGLGPKIILRSSSAKFGGRLIWLPRSAFSTSCKAAATAVPSPSLGQYEHMSKLSRAGAGAGADRQSLSSSSLPSNKKTQVTIQLQHRSKVLSSSLADPASLGMVVPAVLRKKSRHLLSSKSKPKPTLNLKTITPPSWRPPPSAAPPLRKQAIAQNQHQRQTKHHHHDLPSYLAYLNTTGTPATSNVAKGTLYEYTALAALSRLGFQRLIRSGGSNDNGVDLHGLFAVAAAENGSTAAAHSVAETIKPSRFKKKNEKPGQNRDLRQGIGFKVIVQCKATKRSLGSKLMREMAGVHARSVHDDVFAARLSSTHQQEQEQQQEQKQEQQQQQKRYPTVLLLVSDSGLTQQALAQLRASNMPLAYLSLNKLAVSDSSSDDSSGGSKRHKKNYKLPTFSAVIPNKMAETVFRQHGLVFETSKVE